MLELRTMGWILFHFIFLLFSFYFLLSYFLLPYREKGQRRQKCDTVTYHILGNREKSVEDFRIR